MDESQLRRAAPTAVASSKTRLGKRLRWTKMRYGYEVAIGPNTHRVDVTVSLVSGKRSLVIDGETVDAFKSRHSTTVPGAHNLDVRVKGAFSRAKLVVDGTKFKALAAGAATQPETAPAAAAVAPLALAGAGRLLADAASRTRVAEAAPPTHRERTLALVHAASSDGYDLGRALDAVPADAAAVVAVEADDGAVFGCFLSHVPRKRDTRADPTAAVFRLGPSGGAWMSNDKAADAAFVVAARTDAFLGVGLEAASAGAALRLDASLTSASSDPSPLFGSPRLHGGDAVADVEIYALRPHR